MIGDNRNFTFFKCLTIAVLDTLESEVYWNYEFASGTKKVIVPFYYSMTGDEKFVIDTFSDDVVSDNRKTDLNTDVIPRGVLTYTGHDIQTDQMTNPNIWIKVNYTDKDEIKNMLARIIPMPIVCKYDIVITLNNVNDVFSCSEAIMDTLGIYRYLTFNYNNININAVIQFPESSQIEITHEVTMTSKNDIKMTIPIEVLTVRPAYRKPNTNNTTDTNNTWKDAYLYDDFKNMETPIIYPKKTKWYSNIYKSNTNNNE